MKKFFENLFCKHIWCVAQGLPLEDYLAKYGNPDKGTVLFCGNNCWKKKTWTI